MRINQNAFARLAFFLQALHLAVSQTCPSDQTPTDMLGPFYVASTPFTTVIGPDTLLQDPTQRLDVSGNVRSAQDCTKGLSRITIEIWYAGIEGYRDDEYRGMFVTEACGKYNYTQTFPALYTGRPLHVHVRASRGEEELLVTQMYFVGQEFGFQPSRSLQAVEILQADDGSRSVRFDIYIDIEGDEDADCLLSIGTPPPVESAPVSSPVVEESPSVASPSVASIPQPTSEAAAPVDAPMEALFDETIPSTSVLEPTASSNAAFVSIFGCLALLLASFAI